MFEAHDELAAVGAVGGDGRGWHEAPLSRSRQRSRARKRAAATGAGGMVNGS